MRSLSPAFALVLRAVRPVALVGYRILIRTAARYLRRGLGAASVYIAGTGASGEVVVGLSDIDLVVVLGGTPEAVERNREIVLGRWRRFQRSLGFLARGFGVAVYAEQDLADEDGATVLTYGLAGGGAGRDAAPGYLRPGRPVDDLYRRLHPGIYGPGRTWRLVNGASRACREPIGSADYRLLAAWLELQWWWRFSFELCASPHRAYASFLAYKLVAEPARIWLWLAHGERVGNRRQAIERALELLPEEGDVLRGALRLYSRLPRAGDPPRSETLAWLLRAGQRMAMLIEGEVLAHGAIEVRLRNGDVVLGREAADALQRLTPSSAVHACVPLADWRSRAMPPRADEALVAVEADAADPTALGALVGHGVAGLQPAVRAGHLLVLPSDAFSDRVLLRSVQCAPFDPVSFAVLDGRQTAAFPEVAGLSALDSARRAVREHRAWLTAWQPREPSPVLALDLLFTAARAALFLESVEAGDPELPLSAAATVACLGERHSGARSAAEDAYAVFRDGRASGQPSPAQPVQALRGVVESLASYRARS